MAKILGLAIFGVLVLLLGGLIGAVALSNTETVEVEKKVLVNVSYNDSVILADLTVIKDKLLVDDKFEADAIALAVAEYSDDDNEVIFDGLVDLGLSIVDEEDIESIIVRDTDVSGLDSEDKNAIVVQELKVYYEDADGDDKKAYVTVTTEVEDGEVVDQDVELTSDE